MPTSESNNAWPQVFREVRKSTGGSIREPPGDWEARELADGRLQLRVQLPASILGRNLQDDSAAAPFFALCIAWWYEWATSRETVVSVVIDGDGPSAANEQQHWRRAMFLLGEVAGVLKSRFSVTPNPMWTWPARPVLNKPGRRAELEWIPGLSERALEVQLATSDVLLKSFPEPLERLENQLPVGLFNESVSEATSWTPHGKSQVDLWGKSPDGKVVHFIELKTRGNAAVGILPEAFYYARLLHHFRLGKITGGAPALSALRTAERIVMWLVAPEYHPLIYLGGKTPLVWLNNAMKPEGVELRILPIALDMDRRTTWRTEEMWPPR